MNFNSRSITACTGALLLAISLGCEKKLSEEAWAAQEAAKTADARVTSLEQQLAELNAAKETSQADKATAEHVANSQAKALQRQLADLKRSAEAKHRSATEMATEQAPAHRAGRPVIVEIPERTPFSVRLGKELTTSTVQPGDTWNGTLTEDIVVTGKPIWRAGTEVRGVVTQSIPAGRLSSGQGSLGIKATVLGQEDIDTLAYVMVGDKRGARNAKFIGGGAALGALVGILADGKNKGDHALGGAAVGAAAGTATAAATAETVIRIPAEQTITFSFSAPEKISLRP